MTTFSFWGGVYPLICSLYPHKQYILHLLQNMHTNIYLERVSGIDYIICCAIGVGGAKELFW